MNKVLLAFWIVFVFGFLQAQTILFTESWESEPANWTFANGTLTNKWQRGTATAAGGSNAVYISNNDGVTNAYNITSYATAHIYRDIAFPAGLTSIVLMFDVKCAGESSSDYLRVYMYPTTTTPVGNTTSPSTTNMIGNSYYNGFNANLPNGVDWHRVTINIPTSWAGQTGRLTFTWRNDSSGGTQPPVAIDNIYVFAMTATEPPLPVTAISPINNLTHVPIRTTFGWTANTLGNAPTGYTLYFGTTNPPTGAGISVTNATYYAPPSPLANNTTYYWRVVPSNANGSTNTAVCPVYSFTTVPANPGYDDTTKLFTETWESGMGGWTAVNGTLTNQWHRGSDTSMSGSYAMYISNNEGITNAYTPTSTATAHLYRDVAFPATVTTLVLNFDVRCYGESSSDYLRVFMYPLSTTPVAGTTAPTSTNMIGNSYYNGLSNNLPNGTDWHNVSINIPASWVGQTGRLTFTWRNDGSGGTQPPVAIDNVAIFALSPSDPPLPPVIQSPPNGLTYTPVSTSLSWTPNALGNAPTGYTVYLGTTNPPTGAGVSVGNVTNFTPASILSYGTTYYWRVVPSNGNSSTTASICPVWSFTTRPANPSYDDPLTLFTETWESGTGGWVFANGTVTNQWHRGTATSASGNNSVYISNDVGVSNAYSLTSSATVHFYRDIPFPATATNIFLNFDVRCYGESSQDFLRVFLYQTNVIPAGGTATLTTTSMIGNNYYNGLSNNLPNGVDWHNVTINIPANTWAGKTGRLVFTWRNDGSTGNQSPAAIDNISIFATNSTSAPLPVSLVSPAGGLSHVPVATSLSWSANTLGNVATGYTVYIGTTNPPTGAGASVGSVTNYTPTTPLSYGTTYYWRVVPSNQYGTVNATLCRTGSFTTNPSNPGYNDPLVLFTETWETGTNGWVLANGTLTNQWQRGTDTASSGQYSMYISNNAGTSNAYTLTSAATAHIYRDISFPANATSLLLNFDVRCWGDSSTDYLRVYMYPIGTIPAGNTTTPTTTNMIGNNYYNGVNNNLPNGTNWHNVSITIPSTWAGQTGRLTFTWRNDSSTGNQPPAAIDNISVYAVSASDPPLPANIVSPLPNSINVSINTPLSWSPNTLGSAPSGYTVYLGTTNPPTTQGITLGNVTSITPTPPLIHDTTYYWRVVPNNQQSAINQAVFPVWSFKTVEPNLIFVGNGTTTAREVPFNMYYGSSISQVIYYASELAEIPPGSTIQKLIYQYTSTSINLDENISIYMKNTTLNEFATTTSWEPFSGFTAVYTGAITANRPTGQAEVVFNGDTFVYDGGNIIVAVTELVSGRNSSHSSSNWYYTADASSRNRALYYRTDSTVPNIASPPAGTRTTQAPNTAFGFQPSVGANVYITPSTLNIESLREGTPILREFLFRAYGEAPVNITSISGSAGITTTQAPFTIPTGGSVYVVFSIVSSVPGVPFTGTITATSDAVNSPHTASVYSPVVIEANLITVGTGTSTSRELPFNMYYGMSLSQTIYYANELEDVPPGSMFARMAYRYTSTSIDLNETINVYMLNTTQTDFVSGTSWVPYASMTHVYSGPITALRAVGEASITLNMDPFVYEGGNIIVGITELVSGYNSSHSNSNWYYSTDPSSRYRSIYYRVDSTTINPASPPSGTRIASYPNTLFTFQPPTGSSLYIQPTTLTINSINQNVPIQRDFLFRAFGSEAITITNISGSAGISTTTQTPFAIQPGQSISIPITIVSSAMVSPFTGTFTVTSSAANSPHVATITATTVFPENMVEISGGTALTVNSVPMSPYWRYNYSQSIYTPDDINMPSARVITQLQYHYNANQNYPQTVSIYLGHTTQNDFSATNISSFIPFSQFTQVFTGLFDLSTQVDPVTGGSWVNVIFQTPFVYDSTQNLAIAFLDNNDGTLGNSAAGFYHKPVTGYRSMRNYVDGSTPYDPANLVQNTMERYQSVPNIRLFFGPPITGPYITLPQRSLAFGEVSINHSIVRSVLVSNLGTAPLVINSISLPLNMQCNQAVGLSIAPSQNATFDFTLTPTVEGAYFGDIVIGSNATNEPSISITTTATVVPERVIVGQGVLTNQHLPVELHYSYTYSQSLYFPADLVEIGDGAEITFIGYKYNGHEAVTQNVQIYMGHTNQSTFTNNVSSFVPISELTLVYSGAFTAPNVPNTWVMLPLTEAFVYNASMNLVIAFNDNTGPDSVYQSDSCEFYCTATNSARSLTTYKDTGGAFNPSNLTVTTNIYAQSAIPNTMFLYNPAGMPRPRNLTGEVGYGNITLSWDAPNRSEIEQVTDHVPTRTPSFMGYKVYRNGFDIISGLQENQYVDTEVSGGVTYTYFVTAEYLENEEYFESAPSNAIQMTAITIVIVSHPPTDLVALGSSGNITLQWQPGSAIFNESFDTTLSPLWLLDEWDGDGLGWDMSPFGGIDGDGYIYSSSLDDGGNLINPYNFLISPAITIPADGAWLNYWIGAYDENTTDESYQLMIGLADFTSPDNFIIVYRETLTDYNWQRRSYNLLAFASQSIRFAFYHETSWNNPSPHRNRLKLDGVQIVKLNDGNGVQPLSYRVYLDYQMIPGSDSWQDTEFFLPILTSGYHDVYVTAVYDASGTIESTPSNVVRINYLLSDADALAIPQITKLNRNYPNPFNPTTTISFDIARSGHTCIEIFNVKGQRVKVLSDAVFSAGRHSVVWNGDDTVGHPVSSGVYFYRMVTEDVIAVEKMLLLK